MKTNKVAKLFICGGLLLIAAALCLVAYNFYQDTQAEASSAAVLREIRDTERTSATEKDKSLSVEEGEGALEIPEYLQNPNMPMPTLEIDGEEYIGVIDIPVLNLSLPVISEWSDAQLKIAPCRYEGSLYSGDLIIAGHNYQSHFGALKNLQLGDKLYFTDMLDNVFAYEVVELETLDGSAVDSMLEGDWDLTLFTCLVGGKMRVTVRCERAE